jgi:hypothetical protein
MRKGRVRSPFNTVDEMIDSLKGRNRRIIAEASLTPLTWGAHPAFGEGLSRRAGHCPDSFHAARQYAHSVPQQGAVCRSAY